MKIAQAYFEFGGRKGIGRAVAALSSRMASLGHDVEVHCAAAPDSTGPGVHVRRVRAINSFTTLGLVSFAIAARRSIRSDRYDIVHTHGNVVGFDVITAHSCHKAAMEVARRNADKESAASRNLGIADALRLFLERRNYAGKRFKKVIAVSEGVKRELMEHYRLEKNDVRVIPNGVDLSIFTPELGTTYRQEVRRRLGIGKDDFLLVFVGNEFGRKGLRIAIEALSLVRNNVKLLVLGSDSPYMYQALARQHRVGDRILFAGSVHNTNTYYAASDVFLLPTLYEAFALATLEAAACGLPLLVTKVNGTDELMEDGVNGFFIERHAESVAEKITTIADDDTLHSRMAAMSRLQAGKFSWDSITHQTLAVYNEVRQR